MVDLGKRTFRIIYSGPSCFYVIQMRKKWFIFHYWKKLGTGGFFSSKDAEDYIKNKLKTNNYIIG